ncbi:MAG: hypothetical protein KDD62_00585 [Bdellovibrionales bacterium]|nr:hypothetical protein [Bdellovibrionales bacterium]
MLRYCTLLSMTVFTIAWPLQANADVLSAYFSKDSTRDIFGSEIAVSEATPYILQLPKREKKEKLKEADTPEAEKIVEPTLQKVALENTDDMGLAERLGKKYGNPEEVFPVTAIETAPAPFKAMIEALQEGDQKLAFKYAIQYTRYKDKLLEVNQKALSLIGHGLVKEGIMDENSWVNNPAYSEDAYLRTADLNNGDDKRKQPSMEEKATAALAQARNVTFKDFSDAMVPSDVKALELDEEVERKAARTALKGRIPVDPKGVVDVYYFFDPRNKELLPYAKDIQFLNESIEKDPNANFMALTFRRYDSNEVFWFQRKSDSKFPVQSGETLAKGLNVKDAPSVLFVTRTSNQFHIEKGIKNFYFLDEVRKIMQGEV